MRRVDPVAEALVLDAHARADLDQQFSLCQQMLADRLEIEIGDLHVLAAQFDAEGAPGGAVQLEDSLAEKVAELACVGVGQFGHELVEHILVEQQCLDVDPRRARLAEDVPQVGEIVLGDDETRPTDLIPLRLRDLHHVRIPDL